MYVTSVRVLNSVYVVEISMLYSCAGVVNVGRGTYAFLNGLNKWLREFVSCIFARVIDQMRKICRFDQSNVEKLSIVANGTF